MQIKYEHLDYQSHAISSITDLFLGELYHGQDGFILTDDNHQMIIANQLTLVCEEINKNLNHIQNKNSLSLTTFDEPTYQFTVEMETGTGKTYVYLKTIFELNKQYGWKKFIIVVPSVAIREGVLQSLHSMQSHFNDEYNNTPFDYYQYDSKKNHQIKNFAKSTHIQIMIMNIQAFEKDANIINQVREYGRLIDLLKETNPIVIIDEPQNIDTAKRKNAIDNLNPLFTVGYSATHKNNHHKVYSLNPVQAYELGLVKQIAVRSVVADNNHNNMYIKLLDIIHKGKRLEAVIQVDVNDKTQIKRKNIKVKQGDNLFDKTKNSRYQDLVINGLDFANQAISFDNGLIIDKNNTIDDNKDDILKTQIRETIKEHIAREKILKPQGIKVLSLFFIDKVANYRNSEQGKTGKLYQWFEEIYKQETGQSPTCVHNGYFSQDKNGYKDSSGTTKDDYDTYKLIMQDKERLLSLDEPLCFIFSHSALREGWDNPNVFQICTLNETASVIRKRQEIGRGLRLAVNQHGERIYDEQINILTIIANESYEEFAKNLQQEYQDECGMTFVKPKKFKIPTPLGNYNPDWAVVINGDNQSANQHNNQQADANQQIHFIAETKNTGKYAQDGVVMDKLSTKEQLKIACAKRHFELSDVVYQVVQKLSELSDGG